MIYLTGADCFLLCSYRVRFRCVDFNCLYACNTELKAVLRKYYGKTPCNIFYKKQYRARPVSPILGDAGLA